MPRDTSDARQEACDELAALLMTDAGLHTLRLLMLTKTLVVPLEPAEKHAPLADGPLPIGIWEPERQGDALRFVRAAAHPEDALWPKTPILEPKRGLLPLRIVLLGESAATGWVYAPEVTPATLLQQELARATTLGRYEVVDLTRVDLGPRALLELARASLQIDPDLLVVFAGNNWPVRSPGFSDLTLDACQQAAVALRENGFSGLCRLRAKQTEDLSRSVLADLAAITDGGAVSVVLVVPEVNLADWEQSRPVAWLPGDASMRWHALHQRATALLRGSKDDARAALSAALEMRDLDGGTCPTSHRLVARARILLGETDEARDAARLEIETRSFDNNPSIPGATLGVQALLREAARRNGWACVNLPDVFGGRGHHPLPGSNLFLDYCHLTIEGMQLWATATAQGILSIAEPDVVVGSVPAHLERRAATAAPGVEARARLLSGLFRSHWSSAEDAPRQSVADFSRAIQASPASRDALRAYVLSRTAARLGLGGSADLFAMGDEAWSERIAYVPSLDAETTRLLRELLREHDPRLDGEYLARLVAAHDMGRAPVDLLHPVYAYHPREALTGTGGFAHEATAFYRAAWPTSDFAVVADGSRDLAVRWTARLPSRDGDQRPSPPGNLDGRRLVVHLDATEIGTASLTTSWEKGAARIPREALGSGIHRLRLSWPALAENGSDVLADIVRRLEDGLPVDLHPVFGEVFSLQVGPADDR